MSNSGTVTVQNGVWSAGICNAGTITNSNLINISNSGAESRGILTVGTLTNTGTITITLGGGTGIENGDSVTNSGTITVDTKPGAVVAYGISNFRGTFTNEVSGKLTNNIGSQVIGPAGVGSYEGALINYGAIDNYGLVETWGWAMLNYGTINNHGTFYQSYSDNQYSGVWVNHGTFQNYGTIGSAFLNSYALNYKTCTNVDSGVGCDVFK